MSLALLADNGAQLAANLPEFRKTGARLVGVCSWAWRVLARCWLGFPENTVPVLHFTECSVGNVVGFGRWRFGLQQSAVNYFESIVLSLVLCHWICPDIIRTGHKFGIGTGNLERLVNYPEQSS